MVYDVVTIVQVTFRTSDISRDDNSTRSVSVLLVGGRHVQWSVSQFDPILSPKRYVLFALYFIPKRVQAYFEELLNGAV